MRSTSVGTGWVVFVTILVSLFFLSPLTLAAEDAQPGPTDRTGQDSAATLADSLSLTSRKDPIHIRSHDLEFFYEEKRIQYRGNVVVTQGDMTLKSDRLTVLYEDPEPAAANTTAQQRLKHIVAEGRVEITSGERRATSRKAIFNQQKRTVTLRGNAVLQEGPNQVKGDIVTIFLDENRSIVKGGKGKRQAQMVLIPD